ncbi:NAD(P)H-hydrate dehydratase [Marinomonas ostreistagni]|uniref:NAD(P)H-hydrate dehydratase n=1 Tax=Marinomonas ostreistagni TaxID=359209 RepID=UPI00194EC09E|nr:NAD(P)H-hydrate dehydratase [Marinomonas ostreistagni]MBM6549718.1 NAD(P)H-hydrate dehydratase [Marinomonas ostreistagni]
MLPSIPKRYLQPLFDIAAIRRREQASFAQEGESFAMMQRAGHALWQHILKRSPDLQQLAIVVGGGNNGGDGLIVAYLAAQEGVAVRLYDFASSARQGDAKQAMDLLDQQPNVLWCAPESLADESAGVIVDALLGIGFKPPLSALYAEAIEVMNALGKAGAELVSVDCPSGLELHSGAGEQAIKADLVVSFIADKVGHHLRDGAVCCHQVVIETLQAVDLADAPQAYRLAPSALDTLLPCERFANSHKGSYGHVLVLGGDMGMGGAAIMASEAAGKAGAGTVALLTQPSHLTASLVRNPNVMCHTDADIDLEQTLRGQDSVVVAGPGLGRSKWSEDQWLALQKVKAQWLVVDADGLYWLKQQPIGAANLIITPHPGEAAMLLEQSVQAVLENLTEAAKQLARRYQAVVILKGATSVIADVSGQVVIAGQPCPGLAKGGSGDVLSGVVGACLAYYKEAFAAAVIGAAWHNKAAQQCANDLGMVTMQPYQLLNYLE